MDKQMIYINIKQKKCLFYNVAVSKKETGYITICYYGNLGNKGKASVIYEGENYKSAVNALWNKINEKKSEGYKFIEDVEQKINDLFNIAGPNRCDLCRKEISTKDYDKINNFLRKETSVDEDENNIACRKVLCFDCQKKHSIISFRKK